jgi:glycosyltransferase involved in cell wall biosynthesis
MKDFILNTAKKFGIEIRRYTPESKIHIGEIVTLRPKKPTKGNMLLSYVIEPFLLKEEETISNAHTHDLESLLIAEVFLEFGYGVDVIDYRDETFTPTKEYSFFVSARTNFERIARLLNDDCVKIVHLDMAHWLFNNRAAYERCLSVKERRGVALRSYKMQELNWAIEHADYATILGNEFTIGTYDYAQKYILPLSVPTFTVYPWPEKKNYEACRNHFLWFGSEGLVHKGLDLVLEIFSEMSGYHLTVCGPIQKEKDFEKAYYKELYETPNIHTIGWIDVTSPHFLEITRRCLALVYPSCAEGQSGAVVTCLQAGLIPIVSYQSGVDVHDFGVILNDCSKREIMDSIRLVSSLPATELRRMSKMAWEFARANHTGERFTEEYRNTIKKIIAINNSKEKYE